MVSRSDRWHLGRKPTWRIPDNCFRTKVNVRKEWQKTYPQITNQSTECGFCTNVCVGNGKGGFVCLQQFHPGTTFSQAGRRPLTFEHFFLKYTRETRNMCEKQWPLWESSKSDLPREKRTRRTQQTKKEMHRAIAFVAPNTHASVDDALQRSKKALNM